MLTIKIRNPQAAPLKNINSVSVPRKTNKQANTYQNKTLSCTSGSNSKDGMKEWMVCVRDKLYHCI